MDKKKGKKGKEEQVNEEVVQGPTEESVEAINLLTETIFLTKIKELEDEKKTITNENQVLKTELGEQKANEADVYYYLHKKLDDNFDIITLLEKQIIEKNTLYEETKIQSKNEKEQEQGKNTVQIDTLTGLLKTAETSLESLHQFQQIKEEMEKETMQLKNCLEKERKEHEEETLSIERKNVQEKERLKKEMLIKIKETKQNLLSMTEDQLHTTTKRTIMENEQLVSELAYQSKESEKLLGMNRKLEKNCHEFRLQLEIKSEGEMEWAKRCGGYQQTIKKLQEKLHAVKVEGYEKSISDTSFSVHLKESELKCTGMKKAISELQTTLVAKETLLKGTKKELGTLQKQFRSLITAQNGYEQFLTQTLHGIRTQMQPHRGDEVEDHQRMLMLSLYKLENYQQNVKMVYSKENSRSYLQETLGMELPLISPTKLKSLQDSEISPVSQGDSSLSREQIRTRREKKLFSKRTITSKDSKKKVANK